MKYKIIVDKQSRLNPTTDKREYTIDIEELRFKGNVYDSLIITANEDYVLRRLKLTEYYVLEELEEPIKESIENINIELFEGDNYIYLVNMEGNVFYAEYIISNDFNKTYVRMAEMKAAINTSATEIDLAVNQKLQKYSTTEEMNSAINLKANEINAKVEKKIDEDTVTGAYLILKINGDTSEAKLNSDKIELSANDVLNLLAGNTINLSSRNIIISSDNFKLDKNGNMECKNGKFTGGKIELVSNKGNSNFIVKSSDGSQVNVLGNGFSIEESYSAGIPGQLIIEKENNGSFKLSLLSRDLENTTEITPEGIETPYVHQPSLATKKKNFEIMSDNALDILKNIDIYKYNLKFEEETNKKHIGFVIGDKYNYSREVTTNENDGVDIYSFISVCCKAIQELSQQVEELQNKLKEKEDKNG